MSQLANIFIIALSLFLGLPLSAQMPQSPSPMVEHIREHPRLERESLAAERHQLATGTLSIVTPVRVTSEGIPLVIAFHCGDWIPEVAVSRLKQPLPCLSIQLGSGSSRYSEPFAADSQLLDRLVDEASQKLDRPITEVILVGWSAGYGAIGKILSQENTRSFISSVLLIDGLHAGYETGKPGPKESALETKSLVPFLEFAKKSVNSQRRMIIVHSEIFPGTYASTTETSDWLLRELSLRRKAELRWGPMKTQIIGETTEGNLVVRAFAGNSAPDHVDLLHALPQFLQELVDQPIR